MARFQKGRKKTGGRKAGVRNKTTQKRIDAAERAIALAKAGGKRLAREVLEDFVELFSAIALTHQPALPGAERNPNYDEKKVREIRTPRSRHRDCAGQLSDAEAQGGAGGPRAGPAAEQTVTSDSAVRS
jgi:hypothetical protein